VVLLTSCGWSRLAKNIGDPLPPDAKITELLRQLNDLIAEAQHPARD